MPWYQYSLVLCFCLIAHIIQSEGEELEGLEAPMILKYTALKLQATILLYYCIKYNNMYLYIDVVMLYEDLDYSSTALLY